MYSPMNSIGGEIFKILVLMLNSEKMLCLVHASLIPTIFHLILFMQPYCALQNLIQFHSEITIKQHNRYEG